MMTDPKFKILIVDDDSNNNDIFSEMLEDIFILHFATTGEAAVSEALNFGPDLVILDIMLPDIEGFEVCERLKSLPEFENVPIIFLTAKMKLEDKVKGFQVGGADYITKPFEVEEVLARLGTHLSLRKAHQTIQGHNNQLERLLEERTKELIKTERRAAFSLMIQGIIHDLNGPLSCLSINIETVTSKLKSLEHLVGNDGALESEINKIVDYLDLSFGCCKNMEEMIQSLMRKSHSDQKNTAESLDINQMIISEFKFLESKPALKNKIKKEILLHDGPLMIKAVPSEVAQVFSNLINNAIDALRTVENARIIVKTGMKDDHVFFSVQDNGEGVAEESKNKIFDPFYSTKDCEKIGEDSDVHGGLGLGLFSCSEIMKSYGGTISLAETEEQGALFVVEFPHDSSCEDHLSASLTNCETT